MGDLPGIPAISTSPTLSPAARSLLSISVSRTYGTLADLLAPSRTSCEMFLCTQLRRTLLRYLSTTDGALPYISGV